MQFKSSKCFSSLILINREENSTLLEQVNCRDPGSNQGPLDLQSNALPTELSRLEKLTTDFQQVFQFLPKIFYFYIIKPHGRLKTSTVIFVLDLNDTVGIFSGKRRTTGSVFCLRLMFLLAPNCKLLKISWVKMRTKICLNCRFFVITHFLQFRSCKCFSCLIVINREENSMLLEQLNYRDPGSNQGPLDLQSYALPTELSRLEELLPTSEWFSNFCQIFFYFYIIKPHGRLKTSTVIFILDLNNTVGIFSGKRRTTGSVFYLRLMFLLAPNCKLLKISWNMKNKNMFELSFFMKTHLLQFKSSKCFSSLIVINREENSTLLD